MHNNLMKRYERELKTNMQHVETITTLNVSIPQTDRDTDSHRQIQTDTSIHRKIHRQRPIQIQSDTGTDRRRQTQAETV